MSIQTLGARLQWLGGDNMGRINQSKYMSFQAALKNDYNKRMIGFVAERLINIWIHQNRLSVKEMPVVFTESNSRIKHFFKNL